MHVSGAELAFFPVQPKPGEEIEFRFVENGNNTHIHTHTQMLQCKYIHSHTLTADYNTCRIDQTVQMKSKLVPSHVTSHVLTQGGKVKVRLTDRGKTENCIATTSSETQVGGRLMCSW